MSQSLQNPFILQSLGLSTGSAGGQPPQRRAPASSSAAGPRAQRSPPRLQFKSPWDIEPPRYNPDGTENIEWARRQSALRLKTKWESIYERFKDAHLEDQDEIYLGRPGVDEPRIIRDRGSLRALSKQLRFGSFIRDEDLRAFEDDSGEESQSDDVLDTQRTHDRTPPTHAPACDADLAVELDIYNSVKREAVESLLRTDTFGRTVPYDIPGLAEMLDTVTH